MYVTLYVLQRISVRLLHTPLERVAQAEAQARVRKQRPYTLGRAVKAIGESAPHVVRWVMRQGRALKRAIGLREGRRAFGRTVTQMPEDTTPDDRGQGDPLGETAAVLLIGQDRRRQGQPTPGQHRDQAVLAKGADHTREGQIPSN